MAVRLARFARWIASISLASSLVILAGWTWRVPWMTGVVAGSTSTRPNAAICLALISAAVIALSTDSMTTWRRRAVYALLGVALLIVTATIAEYVFGLKLAIDEAFFLDLEGGASPGRMGLNTTLALLLLVTGAIFVTRGDAEKVTTGHILITLCALIAFLGMLGYVYGDVNFYKIQYTNGMSPVTAVLLFALSGALLWVSRDGGFMRYINSENASGFLIRRMLPPIVILPVVLGWLRLQGQLHGYFGTSTGTSLLITTNVLSLGVLIAVNSRMLFRSETEREGMQSRLRANVADVERQIAERTKEFREATALLAVSEQRFALAVDGSESGILDGDIVAGTLFCSPRWKAMLGLGDGKWHASPQAFLELVHPDDRDRATALLFDHYRGVSATFSTEVRMRHADGAYRWMLSRGQAIRDEKGRAIRMVGSQTDITELKSLQERLRTESIHDALTGLYNRRYFEERLSSAVNAAIRHTRSLSVCICDIDDFKRINDSFGHPTGDRVLQSFADILRRETRAEDIVARYGGDEFCIIFPEVNATQASVCGERIRMCLAVMPLLSDSGERFAVTASFGIAQAESTDAAAFIGAADRALYEAKGQGRNRLAVAR